MTLRVVLVDDTPEIRLLLRVGLEAEAGFEVVGEAENGRRAIEMVAEHKPDAVVLDLAMPVMDGLQAIPEILAASPDTKIVVLTAFEASQMLDEAMGAGAHAYIEKGMEVEDIAAEIRAVCSS